MRNMTYLLPSIYLIVQFRYCGFVIANSYPQCKQLYLLDYRRTKEPLDESERGAWKSWLKAQHSEN